MANPNSLIEQVNDDMALCHLSARSKSDRLIVKDAEEGWFVRVNH